MKKKVVKMIAGVLAATMLFGMTGCSYIRNYFGRKKMYETAIEYGDFLYSPGRIIGLSEKGKESELLVFPTNYQGERIYGVGSDAFGGSEPFAITNAKKVYYPGRMLYRRGIIVYGDNVPTLYLGGGWEEPHSIRDLCYPGATMYVSTSLYNELEREQVSSKCKCIIANVQYFIYYSDSDKEASKTIAFFVDDVDGDLITVIPPVPYKEKVGFGDKNKYTFEGWYKDMDCTERWDFEKDKTPTKESGEILKLFANFTTE